MCIRMSVRGRSGLRSKKESQKKKNQKREEREEWNKNRRDFEHSKREM